MDDAIIDSLYKVLEGDPNNTALRSHLAELLFRAARWQDSLEQCKRVLADRPDDWAALGYAAACAEALGDLDRARSYRRMQDALAEKQPSTPNPPPDNQRIKVNAGFAEEDEAGGDGPRYEPESTAGISLADVAGMEDVKKRLRVAFLAPLKNPEMMRLYGKTLRGGLLLYGPPGCGKTHIARAIAGELGARFLSVGISDVLDMYLGQSERNLRAVFETARRASPCVLFFDEIDALGRKRSLRRESAGRDMVNQLLAEMDGLGADNAGVFVLAATNHPWDVDTALRRPGRLDRMVLVLPPDLPARQALFDMTLRNRPLEKVDTAWLAGKTDKFSGADVVHLCESAVELALEESVETGKVRAIGMDDFRKVLKDVRPSTPPWFETARNYALFSNEGGVYDELLVYLRANKLA